MICCDDGKIRCDANHRHTHTLIGILAVVVVVVVDDWQIVMIAHGAKWPTLILLHDIDYGHRFMERMDIAIKLNYIDLIVIEYCCDGDHSQTQTQSGGAKSVDANVMAIKNGHIWPAHTDWPLVLTISSTIRQQIRPP